MMLTLVRDSAWNGSSSWSALFTKVTFLVLYLMRLILFIPMIIYHLLWQIVKDLDFTRIFTVCRDKNKFLEKKCKFNLQIINVTLRYTLSLSIHIGLSQV